ncbi:MAG: putative manganese-dependent inorganic diphosphatase [Christensenellales bacterium]|jgi:manganese-dependent inorganic pyrophosphatase
MQTIHVIGHRNPDSDSIVSAIAYAYLRNQLGDSRYRAARLGPVNDETAQLLKRFDFKEPEQIFNVRTQVRDLNFDTPPSIGAIATLAHAWSIFLDNRAIGSLPIIRDDGTLFGVLSLTDIFDYDIKTIQHPVVDDIPLFNLVGVLEGSICPGTETEVDVVSGEITIALPHTHLHKTVLHEDSIVICGNQPEAIEYALEQGIRALIISQAKFPEEMLPLCGKTLVIATPFDAYRAARSIMHAVPVGRLCRRDNLVSFHLDDYLDDVKETMLQYRHNAYPVLDEDNRVVGVLTRYQLIRPRRKKVVLVDHNEVAQSVPGLDQAEILEIIDHHRLADVQTASPILVRNEPIGSTTAIISSIFQERGITPSRKLAGLMAAAILSDTVMLKSPTSTEKDRLMAESMARIGRVSIQELGELLFSASNLQNKSTQDLFRADYKEFHIADHLVGISQITCINSEELMEERLDDFLALMQGMKKDKDYEMVLLMITDVLRSGTELVYVGNEAMVEQAFNAVGKNNHFFLPGVMSRKKQVVPMISLIWG